VYNYRAKMSLGVQCDNDGEEAQSNIDADHKYFESTSYCVICLGDDNHNSDCDDNGEDESKITSWHLYARYTECGHTTYCKRCCDKMKGIVSKSCPICRCEGPCVSADGVTFATPKPAQRNQGAQDMGFQFIELTNIMNNPIRTLLLFDLLDMIAILRATAEPVAEPDAVPTIMRHTEPIIEPVAAPTTMRHVEPVTVPTTMRHVEPVAVPTTMRHVEPNTVPTTMRHVEPVAVPTTMRHVEPNTVPTTMRHVEPNTVPTTMRHVEPVAVPTTIPIDNNTTAYRPTIPFRPVMRSNVEGPSLFRSSRAANRENFLMYQAMQENVRSVNESFATFNENPDNVHYMNNNPNDTDGSI